MNIEPYEDGRITLTFGRAYSLCLDAAASVGMSEAASMWLASACIWAEENKQFAVGLSHFVDYLDAVVAGRLNPRAEPKLHWAAKSVCTSDADKGIAHTGFELALPSFVDAVKGTGIGLFTQRNAYTCGALSYFVGRLAAHGLVALMFANSRATMAGSGSTCAVFGTNPIAFAVPGAQGTAFTIDQSSSSSSFVGIRQYAREGRPISRGWALDRNGMETTDATLALDGSLLPFGGYRGANLALMVEIMAAGLSGGNWSLDAPDFLTGNGNPGVGITIIAIAPEVSSSGFIQRVAAQLSRLTETFGIRLPGRRQHDADVKFHSREFSIDPHVLDAISRVIDGTTFEAWSRHRDNGRASR
jgi:(2R)-3-sulfolactate dehydrogenase (NADP+)